MKKLLIATTAIGLALAAQSAKAGDETDPTQIITAPQDASDYLNVSGNINGAVQYSGNTANMIDLPDDVDADFEDVLQLVEVDGDFQTATNVIETPNEPTDQILFGVEQTAINRTNTFVANDVESSNVATMEQYFGTSSTNPEQVTSNFIGGTPGAAEEQEFRLGDDGDDGVTQAALNYANTIEMDNFDNGGLFIQSFSDSADQTANNTAWFELRADNVTQVAGNVGNRLSINNSDALITQQTGSQSDQEARNFLLRETDGSGDSGTVEDSLQQAFNSVNTVEAVDPSETIQDVNQFAGDSQRAYNELSFGHRVGDAGGDVLADNDNLDPNTAQLASNVMNSLTVREFSQPDSSTLVSQQALGADSDSIQSAVNVAYFTGQGDEAGNVENFLQAASNSVNTISVGTLPSYNGVQEFTQISNLGQVADNSLTTGGLVGNVTDLMQQSVNTANVISAYED